MTKQILRDLEMHLRVSQTLDADYYTKPNPTTADRAAYYHRQERAEELRRLLEVSAIRNPRTQAESANFPQLSIVDLANDENITTQTLCKLTHTLRNQLNVILGCTDILTDHPPEDKFQKLVQQIRLSTLKAAELIRTTKCRIAEISQARPPRADGFADTEHNRDELGQTIQTRTAAEPRVVPTSKKPPTTIDSRDCAEIQVSATGSLRGHK